MNGRYPAIRWMAFVAIGVTSALLATSPCFGSQNAIQIENNKAGSADWQLTNPATNHEIEGYASLTSVNRGGQINFYVNTADPTFTLDVFRMGWYGGAGARRVMAPVQVAGTRQTIPAPDPNTGMVECRWTNPYQLSIPSDPSDPTNWASGVYLARLTGDTSTKQSFIIFVVRDDTRSSTWLFQLSTNTFQAYNNWGGKSLYTWNSTSGVAATQVSYNRPFAPGNQSSSAPGVGAGEFLTNVQPSSEGAAAGWAYNTLRFLEREGDDVTYISDVDAHENGNLLLSHQALIIPGHSEYWSWQMRTNVQAVRDSAKGLAVFSANTCYWQIRFAASLVTGAPDRTIICYKSTADPYASDPNLSYLTTVQWRQAPVNMPEETLFGVMYNTDQVNGDLVVANAANWVYSFTGVQNGDLLPGLWGYEIDSVHGLQPAGTVVLAHETTSGGTPGDSVVYTASSGALVFDAGSFQWNWGLDDFNVPNIRPSVISPEAQQITRNILNGVSGQAVVPAFSVIPSPRVQTVGSTALNNLSYTVSVTSFGYSPAISLSASGLPPGVTAVFSPATIPGSGTSGMTLSSGSPPAVGTYVITINASDGSQARTEAVTLIVTNALPKTNWKLVFVDSQETQCANNPATNGFDNNSATIWHTQWCPTVAPLPHEIQIDLGAIYSINGFGYLPRQDGGINGRIGQYEFYATNNTSSWGTPIATGTFANDATRKQVSFQQNTYRYVRLRALTEANGAQYTSMAELDVYAAASTPDFSISAAPVSQTVAAGSPATWTVSIDAQNGFGGVVNLGASGLPSGATASFNPPSITGSGSSTLTVATTSATPAGNFTLAISGASGSLTHSATATLVVTTGTTGAGAISVDFIGAGSAMASTETAGVIARSNWNNAAGASSSAPLSLVDETGAATGVSVSWSSDNVWSTPIVDSPGNSRMMKGYLDDGSGNPTTVTVSGLSARTYDVYVYTDGDNANITRTGIYQISGPGVATAGTNAIDGAGINFSGTFVQAANSNGNYVLFSGISITSAFTITATPGSSTGARRAPVNGIQIVPGTGGSPDFSVSVDPSSQGVTAGGSTTFTVTIGELNGFSSTVNLSASGLPAGATASFNPASLTASGSSTLTIASSAATPVGSYTLTITGSSGTLTHTVPVTLVVNSTPDFALSVAPSSQTIAPGGSTTYTVSVTALNGFSAAVTLGTSGLPAGATASFSPTSVTGSGTSTLTINTTGSTPPGSSTLTVTGTSGSLTHTAATALVITSSSGPTAIGIDFVGTATAMASTETAGVIAKANWNSAAGASSGSPLSLVDETGTATAATATWNSDNGWSTPITDTAGNNRMMRGYLDNGKGNPTTVTVSGVAAGAYDIYVYLDGDNAGFARTGIYQISGPGIVTASISATDAANTNFSGTFVQANNSAGNYVLFSGVTIGSGFTITATPGATTGGPRAPVNGIQIVPSSGGSPDFSVSASPASQTVAPGGNTSYSITIGASNGFSGIVNLAASGLPAGATASFSPPSVTGAGTSTLTVSTTGATPPGTSTLTITGTSGALTHGATTTLVVASSPDFSITAAPASQTVAPGAAAVWTVTTGALNGFSGSVSLSATGLPGGATASFNPAAITGAGTSALTVSTTGATPAGTSTLTITGSSGSLTHSTTVTLVVSTGTSGAKVISIDFAGSGTVMASTESAGVIAKTNWNPANAARSAAPLNLVDETGLPTSASVTWSADNTWNTPITDTAGNSRMMRGYLDNGSGNPITVTVSTLSAGTYNVYVYMDGDNATFAKTGIYQISGPGITTTSIRATDAARTNFTGVFTQANNSNGNYVLFGSVTIASGFTITATPGTATGAPRSPVNGIQIVPAGP